MHDKTPNSLEPVKKVNAAKMSKWPLYAFLLFVLLLFAALVYGQERVLVAWNRLIFPDGSAFTLGAMPGNDMAGYAGYTDEVNNHHLRTWCFRSPMRLHGKGDQACCTNFRKAVSITC